jgi:hypothetical protein
MQHIEKIIEKLKDKYPQYSITYTLTLGGKGKLFVDSVKIFDFDSNFIKKEIEFLEGHQKYFDFLLEVFEEPLLKYVKKQKRLVSPGRGRFSKPLPLERIIEAINNTKSNRAAARFLNISYTTYKKYSKLYTTTDENGNIITYWDKHLNPYGYGIIRAYAENSGKYSIEAMLRGEVSDKYPAYKIKRRLIKNGYLDEKCSNCGFEERRITDSKVPLLLDFVDGNSKNKKFENLRLLCYNCYYLVVGDIFYKKKSELL